MVPAPPGPGATAIAGLLDDAQQRVEIAQRLIDAVVREAESLGARCSPATGLAATLTLALLFAEQASDPDAATRLITTALTLGAQIRAADDASRRAITLAPSP